METFNPGPRPKGGGEQLAAWYTTLLNEQESSGLSVAQFASKIGMPIQTLYAWKRRLTAPPLAPGQQTATKEPLPGLVQVQPSDEPAVTLADQPLALRIGRQRVIEVPAHFNARELARLIKAVEEC